MQLITTPLPRQDVMVSELKGCLLFVHSDLDDYGLTPTQFRIYAHLRRRAGRGGVAFAGVRSMARICRVNKDTAMQATIDLEALGFVRVEKKHGATNHYSLTRPSEWTVRKQGTLAIGLLSETRGHTVRKQGTPTVRNEGTKGNPTLKVILKGNPTLPENGSVTSEEIYQAYPRKVAKPAALRAIEKAKRQTAPDRLLELTRAYASARRGEEERFTPHPATWFNEERYNDDPKTWGGRGSSKSNIKPDHSKGW